MKNGIDAPHRFAQRRRIAQIGTQRCQTRIGGVLHEVRPVAAIEVVEHAHMGVGTRQQRINEMTADKTRPTSDKNLHIEVLGSLRRSPGWNPVPPVPLIEWRFALFGCSCGARLGGDRIPAVRELADALPRGAESSPSRAPQAFINRGIEGCRGDNWGWLCSPSAT